MKCSLNLIACTCFVFSIALPLHAGSKWETDFVKAKKTAKKTNRYMLVDFSGSDWCGWCIKLDEEVFSKKKFKSYAKENLVCVLLDFPRRKKLKKSLREQNEKLKQEYAVRGFPTVLVLSPEGKLVQRTGYQKGGPENYVAHLKKIIDPHRKKNKVPEPTSIETSVKPNKLSINAFKRTRPAPSLPKDENREVRDWHSQAGSEVRASLVQELGARVVLKKEDGSTIQILRSRLSAEDQKYIADLKSQLKSKTD